MHRKAGFADEPPSRQGIDCKEIFTSAAISSLDREIENSSLNLAILS
jgi:hypothetical protein